MKLRDLIAALGLIGPLLLWLSGASAASADAAPPDREMLRMMDVLREMEMIKQMDMLQEMHNLEQGDVSAKSAPERKPTRTKQKESAK